jgi:uncharacterized protein (TIGR02453 family)
MIAKETLRFLSGLALNNDRLWFEANRKSYEDARQNVLAFTAAVIRGISAFDEAISPDLEAKNCVMRIYRDVRFSKNKMPYKNNFGIGISPGGRNANGPGYYIHIEPGRAFLGGGLWMPAPDHLKMIRQEIDYNGSEFKEIVDNPAFVKVYKGLSREDQLKAMPKGYSADHEWRDYLKLKSFTAAGNISDRLLTGRDATVKIVDMFETLHPLISFLRNAIS